MELAETQGQAGKSLVPGEKAPAQSGENLPPVLRGFMHLARGRQIGVIAALALAIAIAVALLLWSQKAEFGQLFGHLPEKDAGEIVEVLKKMNVDFAFESGTGNLMVPANKVHELRLKLASQGLPRADGQGFEILEKENSFGSSQMMETARFQRALEGEIARSIMTIRNVKAARVHLALPKESVFVRQPKKPSASVMLDLNSGYGLEPGQVEAVVHLVASSVPQLEPEAVTVVDQRGRLLNSKEAADGMNMTAKQFDYKKQVEDHLIERVENILSPVVGSDGMRTQISADIDFSVTERTQELFNPDMPALRSEQTSEEQSRQGAGVQGVPGALSNQPPPAGTAPEVAPGQPARPQAAQAQGAPGQAVAASPTSTPTAPPEPLNATKSATRNYELDKTISHSRLSTGELRRLTVAVVVDHQRVLLPGGGYTLQPYSDEDLTRFSNLVKEAVGYDMARGDRVTVTNAAFRVEPEVAPAPVWEQPWFWSLARGLGVGTVILLLILLVLRPAIRGLAGQAASKDAQAAAMGGAAASGEAREAMLAEGQQAGGAQLALAGGEEIFLLEAPQSYEKRLEFAQKAIDQDSKRVAQVLKTWVSNNG
jgi:flagellar M-ring protein FliF